MRTNTQTQTTGTDRKVSQLKGDGFFRLKRYDGALACYIEADDQEKIATCGPASLEVGQLESGIRAYEALGRIPPAELLIKCGDYCSEFDADRKIAAYELAGASDRLISFAKEVLDLKTGQGEWQTATKAFIASGDAAKIRVIARACLKRSGHVDFLKLAIQAFAAIGDRIGLVTSGHAFLELVKEADWCRKFEIVADAFEAAGCWQSLIELGDLLLERGPRHEQISADKVYALAARLYEEQRSKTNY